FHRQKPHRCDAHSRNGGTQQMKRLLYYKSCDRPPALALLALSPLPGGQWQSPPGKGESRPRRRASPIGRSIKKSGRQGVAYTFGCGFAALCFCAFVVTHTLNAAENSSVKLPPYTKFQLRNGLTLL